ncbi:MULTISPECIES: efflux RND transporter periplasmic adaptor subunit [Methylomonas]|uniref:Efflux transporter periplasmic adaptor subunit n=2 Tax=Methylomonas TaxID=416 RepID=A0A140E6F7_9GAMM|nr:MULTISPECIES: efflux RND transporter periplasmic adaptor subunit [Methylomonas]AMK78981.1 efflux transporter periplasmic adaptor subunit [Methylomonas denitrificans]OAH99164.1 efflux transporter periplasmic adaptor subunit [Methylomonas methanica]TCV77472.1 membrane fusion protein (multidrug efflux system) [Methylomonas methanica]
MTKRILLVLLLTLLILGGLFGMKFFQINQAVSQMQAPPPPLVAVAEVKQEQWPTSLATVGSLRAVAGINISNEVAGQIKALHFESGQTVKQGQLLIELDSTTDQAELQGLQAEQRLAQIRYQRSAQLIDKKFVSQSDYDQNKALLDEARAAVASKQTLIAKKQIKAPFNGELGIRQVDLGQYLPVGSAIIPLQKLDPIFLDFNLPERYLSQLSVGQQITINVQAYPDKSFTGEIIAISPAVEQQSRSLKVQARLKNADKGLHPGMFAQVQIVSGKQSAVLTVPDTALTYNPYGESVFLLVGDDKGFTVQNRQVQSGQSRAGRVEILSGLNAGDKVVSAGQIKLRNGMPVAVDKQPAPGEREAAR